ncbi:hypothetical protein NM208_g12972 [Fusarium decemcellulare]|uniref:Uncharacterized protein n=1 Tax=Fusarium decemcellulare TaxID=57161 RepID=A0ACC1RQ49_9HYPO|nr:hypothetical protein NM208_g12972 [Fusarium decemcellulare]
MIKKATSPVQGAQRASAICALETASELALIWPSLVSTAISPGGYQNSFPYYAPVRFGFRSWAGGSNAIAFDPGWLVGLDHDAAQGGRLSDQFARGRAGASLAVTSPTAEHSGAASRIPTSMLSQACCDEQLLARRRGGERTKNREQGSKRRDLCVRVATDTTARRTDEAAVENKSHE